MFASLRKASTFISVHHGAPNTLASRETAAFLSALSVTALFRCWHILLFYTAWSTVVTVLTHNKIANLTFQPTLLTVLGTVLGFVISYRTTASFERYNEGRRLWSQIILASRTFVRSVWFHVPDTYPGTLLSPEENRARVMIEKKTAINLLEAFAVAVKHYLRGEDGIFYKDLYYLVKYLPSYALPAGLPSSQNPNNMPVSFTSSIDVSATPSASAAAELTYSKSRGDADPQEPGTLPPPQGEEKFVVNARNEEANLLPSRAPVKYHLYDFFPFTLMAMIMMKFGYQVKGRKAARARAKLRHNTDSHNIPLEISLYLSSYLAALQTKKAIDVPTTNLLLASLNQLVDSLTGLERILTTPIPFSYSVHLWVVTIIYCLALPSQLYNTLHWLTIPGTTVVSFIFFGFLVAGEEIENPFGYDHNDLNLDHFTGNIIRNELKAVTSMPPPEPSTWVFSAENDVLFCHDVQKDERLSPEVWVQKGYSSMQAALSF